MHRLKLWNRLDLYKCMGKDELDGSCFKRDAYKMSLKRIKLNISNTFDYFATTAFLFKSVLR